MTSPKNPSVERFPFEDWLHDMGVAIEEIQSVGRGLLGAHVAAGGRAAEVAGQWRLADRLEDEGEALRNFVAGAEEIVRSADALRGPMVGAIAGASTDWEDRVIDYVSTLDEALPLIDAAFATIRHAALDLLRWARRSGYLEGSDWPERYRKSYAALTSYGPRFDELTLSLQEEMTALGERFPGHSSWAVLREALSRQEQIKLRFRSFLQSVIDPPLDLIFEETEGFLVDWEKFPAEARGRLATQFNDCCQMLLYDADGFEQRVETIRPQLVDGMEASLYVLSDEDERVLFLVDEDPLFRQVTVTLLRVVSLQKLEAVASELVETLYREYRKN